MAMGYSIRVLVFLMLISLVAMTLNLLSTAEAKKPRRDVSIVKGLSWNFYQKACPKVEEIIKEELKKVFKRDIGLAAAILRIHFHDCFVQGCEGSVLLAGSTSGSVLLSAYRPLFSSVVATVISGMSSVRFKTLNNRPWMGLYGVDPTRFLLHN